MVAAVLLAVTDVDLAAAVLAALALTLIAVATLVVAGAAQQAHAAFAADTDRAAGAILITGALHRAGPLWEVPFIEALAAVGALAVRGAGATYDISLVANATTSIITTCKQQTSTQRDRSE